MNRKIFLNKREGAGGEIAAVAAVLLLGAGALWLVYRLFFAAEANSDVSPRPMPTLPAASACLADELPGLAATEFKGSPYTCSSREAEKVWSLIRASPYVRGNKLYETVLDNTIFVYDARNDSVNAFAASVTRSEVKYPVVCLHGGAVRFAKLIASALAHDRSGATTNAIALLLAKMTSADCSSISETRAAELSGYINALCAEEPGRGNVGGIGCGAEATLGSEIFHGILLGILAHEAGHQAYGHVHNRIEGEKNLEVSRNQERDADSFCSSVMSLSPYGKFMFEGSVFWWWVMARQEMKENSDVKRSHPLSRERFENIVRANRKLADKLGVGVLELERIWR